MNTLESNFQNPQSTWAARRPFVTSNITSANSFQEITEDLTGHSGNQFRNTDVLSDSVHEIVWLCPCSQRIRQGCPLLLLIFFSSSLLIPLILSSSIVGTRSKVCVKQSVTKLSATFYCDSGSVFVGTSLGCLLACFFARFACSNFSYSIFLIFLTLFSPFSLTKVKPAGASTSKNISKVLSALSYKTKLHWTHLNTRSKRVPLAARHTYKERTDAS